MSGETLWDGDFDQIDADAEKNFSQAVPDNELAGVLEAILMVAPEPVPTYELARVTEHDEDTVTRELKALQQEYVDNAKGFELREVAGGWRIFSRSEYAPWVGRFVLHAENTKLTQAALETLAIIAYRQPITRAKIAEIRGVGVDSVMRTLLARELIEESGTTITGARLYRTTPLFLEKMGFNSLDELLPLAPFLPPREAIDEITVELEEKSER